MLLSMTGYGRATRHIEDHKIKVEVKSLNGKMTDIRLKLAARYREKEMEIRKRLLESAKRGKIDVNISIRWCIGRRVRLK